MTHRTQPLPSPQIIQKTRAGPRKLGHLTPTIPVFICFFIFLMGQLTPTIPVFICVLEVRADAQLSALSNSLSSVFKLQPKQPQCLLKAFLCWASHGWESGNKHHLIPSYSCTKSMPGAAFPRDSTLQHFWDSCGFRARKFPKQ